MPQHSEVVLPGDNATHTGHLDIMFMVEIAVVTHSHSRRLDTQFVITLLQFKSVGRWSDKRQGFIQTWQMAHKIMWFCTDCDIFLSWNPDDVYGNCVPHTGELPEGVHRYIPEWHIALIPSRTVPLHFYQTLAVPDICSLTHTHGIASAKVFTKIASHPQWWS